MKLVTFDAGAGAELGVVDADRVIPLNRAAPGLPADMTGLITAWPQVEPQVRAIAAAAKDALPLASVRPRPRSAARAKSWPSG